MPEAAAHDAASDITLVQKLVQLADIDTLYRDLYLEAALHALRPLLDDSSYAQLKQDKMRLETLALQSRAAIEQGDWHRVPELVNSIRPLQQLLDEKESLLELGTKVYEAEAVSIDPFSPGLQSFLSSSLRSRNSLRETAREILEFLLRQKGATASLYQERRQWFQTQVGREDEAPAAASGISEKDVVEKALSALTSGNVNRLESLALEMVNRQDKGFESASFTGQAASFGSDDLSIPVPSGSFKGAARLGLEPVELAPEPEISSFIHKWAWQPGFPDPTVTQDGRIILKNIPSDRAYPPGITEQRQTTLDLFSIHPFINSAGARYIPRMTAETLLAETFHEDQPPDGSPLLEALHLHRRGGLCRNAIERALLRYGPGVVRTEIGLDPAIYRLACIPYDAYCRLGTRLGLGSQPRWTHFDGYQVLKTGKVLALVGGDVRFGGAFDLCSINPMDEREGVIARFVVLKRTRFNPW